MFLTKVDDVSESRSRQHIMKVPDFKRLTFRSQALAVQRHIHLIWIRHKADAPTRTQFTTINAPSHNINDTKSIIKESSSTFTHLWGHGGRGTDANGRDEQNSELHIQVEIGKYTSTVKKGSNLPQ